MANTLPPKNNVVLNSKLETIYIYFLGPRKFYIWLFIDKNVDRQELARFLKGKKALGKLFMLWFLKPMGIRCTCSQQTIQVNVESNERNQMTVIVVPR